MKQPIVLVVEDEILIRMSVAEALRSNCFTVLEAGGVEEAQGILSAEPMIEVLFTDLKMAGPDDGITFWPSMT